MSFEPLFAKVITENCTFSGDYIITGDVIVDGTVRIAPNITWLEPNRKGLVNLDWDYGIYFDTTGETIDEGFKTGDHTPISVFTYSGWYSDTVNWPRDYLSIVGREQLVNGAFGTGEVHTFYYTGENFDVDNADGWTIEFTFYVPIYPDENQYQYHSTFWNSPLLAAQGDYWYFDFDDGTKKGRIFFDPFSAIFVPSDHDKRLRELQLGDSGDAYSLYPLKYWTSYELYPRTLRLTVRGDEVWITINDGITGISQDFTPSPSVFTGESSDITTGPVDSYINRAAANTESGLVNYNDLAKGYAPKNKNQYASALGTPPGDSPMPGTPNPTNPTLGDIYNHSQYGELPPSQREPIQPPSYKYTFHTDNAGLAASSGTKKLSFNHGLLGEKMENTGVRASVLMLDYLFINGIANHEGAESITFSGDFTTISPECQPIFRVNQWDTCYLKSIYLEGGNTYILPQYYAGASWSDYGSWYHITGELGSIDISGIPTSKDLTDKIRFKIHQVAVEPSGEPPRLDKISITAQPVTGDFDLYPYFGTTQGGNEVTLSWRSPPGSFVTGQEVWVGDTQIDSSNIQHVDSETKIVTMPAHTAGTFPVKVVGSTYWSIKPYTYVDEYDIERDLGPGIVNTGDLEATFGNTRSAFRILSHPPDHSVNLAFLGTKPLSVDTHMSLINLSDREPSNLVGYGAAETKLYNGTSGDYIFTGAADTEDILVSNRAAMWRDLESPRILYYKYLIGRGRYYVQVPSATGEDNLDTIRSAISVYEDGGVPASFAWDIIASSKDFDNEDLPQNVFSVILLVSEISQNTMWVSYRGADRLSDFDDAGVRHEIINPVPLFDNGSGRLNFKVTPSYDGSYDVEVEI